jgi:transposase
LEWSALKCGHPGLDDRATLTGILFVLRSGIPWEMLPAEMNCGCGMSCWRRLRDWQAAAVWRRLHQVQLERLPAAGEIDWSRASVDSASVPAKKGGLPPARPRRTGARRASSATSSPMRVARRSASS